MRVIYFTNGYTPHDHRFLAALAKTRHTVFLLRLEGEKQADDRRALPENIEQLHWDGGRARFRWGDVPRLALDLRRIVRQVKPDLIHAGPIQTCSFLSVLSGFRPILTMSWGFDLMQDAERNAWWRWVTSYTLQRSTFFTSDARVTRDRAVAFGMDPERTLVFPWGVDLKAFVPKDTARRTKSAGSRPKNRRRSKPTHPEIKDGLTLFCNRSWEPRYGVDVLARAFVQAVRQNPNLNLILLGGGSQTHVIRQILGDGAAMSHVLFGGQIPQPQLADWYRMADVFVSPSHVDGSSVSLMEALACGVPALVSDIPANREWVRDGENGWLFEDGDVEGLADTILTLAGGRDQFARMRRAARTTAENQADWSKNFPVLLEAYEKAVMYN